MPVSKWSRADTDALAHAVELLYAENFLIRLASVVGTPIEALVRNAPAVVGRAIQGAAEKALRGALTVAAQTTRSAERQKSWDKLHLVGTAVTGAVGGFFGTAGALAEIPITTTVMFRSILDIARSEGADISQGEIRTECLNVFALGSPSADDDATDTSYLGVRAGLAEFTKEAAAYLAKGLGKKQLVVVSKVLSKYLAVIAGRYGVLVGEKLAAQAVPALGAATGALINVAFTDYFQDIARGHFIVLRLEKKYGSKSVTTRIGKIRTPAKSRRKRVARA